jgi:hypothetical protein
MAATRGQFSQLLAPGLFSVIYEDLEMHPEEYQQFFNVYPTTKAYEEDQLVAGLGAIPPKPEGTPIAYDNAIQGGTVRYQPVSYGMGFQVTREMWDDDQYGIMRKVSQDFAGSIRQTIETTAISILVNSFTSQKSIDGGTLIGTHNLLGGGSYSNAAATNLAFSVSGIQEQLLIFEKMVNERGLIKRATPEDVVIPVDLQFKAQEILHSAYKPYSGTNEVNSVQGRLNPMTDHYLVSPTAWWVLARKMGHTLKAFWRTQPEFDSQDDFQTKGSSFSAFFRFVAGVTYWHGLSGSPGQ